MCDGQYVCNAGLKVCGCPTALAPVGQRWRRDQSWTSCLAQELSEWACVQLEE